MHTGNQNTAFVPDAKQKMSGNAASVPYYSTFSCIFRVFGLRMKSNGISQIAGSLTYHGSNLHLCSLRARLYIYQHVLSASCYVPHYIVLTCTVHTSMGRALARSRTTRTDTKVRGGAETVAAPGSVSTKKGKCVCTCFCAVALLDRGLAHSCFA
jgi:hypothetical protein